MQIGEQYGLAELQQLMVGRGHMLALAQEMPQEMHPHHHLQYQSQQQQAAQFHAGFHQHHRHQIEVHQQNNGNRVSSISAHQYQASHAPQQEENHHSYHLHHAQRQSNNNIAQQLSLGSDSPGGPSLSVSPSSKRTISPPGIISKPQCVNAVARDQAFEDYDEAFDDGDRSGGGANGRWPRQETLTLLKIRSEMDPKFREATHKGPLWDEVSRALAELGYHRSAKKCREKFENLYKYYKKTKEGKAGRQDGKHYRFFSQLEALYGGTSIDAVESCFGGTARPNSTENAAGLDFNGDGASQKFTENYNNNSAAFSLSSDSSSDDDYSQDKEAQDQLVTKGKRKRKHWKSKMKMYFDLQMKKFMDKQEAWLQKVLETLEQREQERMTREEAWRRQVTAQLDREHQLWSNESARAASCNAAFITALQKITGQNLQLPDIITPPPQININPDVAEHQDILNREPYDPNNKRWPKGEILSLIRLRTSMEPRFQEAGAKGPLWEEIAAGMSCLGYDRSAKRCKEKWENINKYFRKAKDSNRKRPENSKTCPYFQQLDSLYRQGALGLPNGGGSTTTTTTISPKAGTRLDHNQSTADELVLQPCSSSHENDDLPQGQREAVEILGLMPSEDCNNNHAHAGGPLNNSNGLQFFSGAENGCNWEGYPMKLKMKQQQHLMDNSNNNNQTTL
eukprot:Gb_02053 [translate_table: standard]